MATSRRRTSKKSVGQNLNEIERRLRSVERRPTPSYVETSLINESSVADGSITIDSLDPSLRDLILTSFYTADTAGASQSTTSTLAVDTSAGSTLVGYSVSGKTNVYYQASPPTSDGRIEDDLWYDTDDDFKPYRWGYESVSIASVVVAGTAPSRTATFTTSATHAIGVDEVLVVSGIAGSGGIGLLNGDWIVTNVPSSTQIRVSIGDGTGITNGTYTSLSGTGTSNLGEWLPAPFGDAALSSLTVGKLLTGTLNVATAVTVGNQNAATASVGTPASSGSIVIDGGKDFTGIKLFNTTGTNTVFMNALTGDASFTGTITSESGSIGGWIIGSNKIYNTKTSGNESSIVEIITPPGVSQAADIINIKTFSSISLDQYANAKFGIYQDSFSSPGISPYINLATRSPNGFDYNSFITQVVVSGTAPNQTVVVTTSIPHAFTAGFTQAQISTTFTGLTTLNTPNRRTVASVTTFTVTFTGISGATNGTYSKATLGITFSLVGYFEQNLYLHSQGRYEGNSFAYRKASIWFDGPDGKTSGVISGSDVGTLSIGSAAKNSSIDIVDLTSNNRSVSIVSVGGASNVNSANVTLTGSLGVAGIQAGTSANYAGIVLDGRVSEISTQGSLLRELISTRRYAATAVTISAASTWTAVNYNTLSWNSTAASSQFSTASAGGIRWYVVPRYGFYSVSGQVTFSQGNGTGRRDVKIQMVNAATTPTSDTDGTAYALVRIPAVGGANTAVTFNDVVFCDEAGDKIVIWAQYAGDSGIVSILDSSPLTLINIEYIGE